MKAIQASAAAEMRLIGGRLCLDFLNTVDGRKSNSPRAVDTVLGDKLADYSDLVQWSRHSGIVNFAFLDGSVRSLADATPDAVRLAIGTRTGGEAVSIPN